MRFFAVLIVCALGAICAHGKKCEVKKNGGFSLPVPIPPDCQKLADEARPWAMNTLYPWATKEMVSKGCKATLANTKPYMPKIRTYIKKAITIVGKSLIAH